MLELETGGDLIATPTRYTNARLKCYPESTVLQVANRDIFPLEPGEPRHRPYDIPPKGHAKNPEKSREKSRRKAVSQVRDIALCNQFSYFFTWTLDGRKIDRYDPDIIYPKLKNFLGDSVKRKGFEYILVPEYHKLKPGETRPAIHFHGLCNLGDVPIEPAMTKDGRQRTDQHGRPVFNMLSWKYGYSTCVPIDHNYQRTANYITKYITKEQDKILGKYFLSSRGLKKGPDLVPVESIPYFDFRDEAKLKVHQQSEIDVCPGLSLLSEEYPTPGA